jgi:glycerol uptake facilitator-like aquaporin
MIYLISGADAAAALKVVHGTPEFKYMNPMAAMFAEFIGTFFLVFVIWGSVADPRSRNSAGFAIGLTIAADILCLGPLTGASMNPARSFGPTLVSRMLSTSPEGDLFWRHHWVYWVGPIAGGLLAAASYHLVLWPRDARRGIDPPAVDVPPTQRPA